MSMRDVVAEGDAHDHSHDHAHGHRHGLVHESIKRSREGLRAVGLALVILGATAVLQLFIFVASGSVALLADLIHNFGDAATALPLGVAFALRSAAAERWAGLAVVLAIFVSACVAGYEAIDRLIDPQAVGALLPLALAASWASPGTGGRRSFAPAPAADWEARHFGPTATTRGPMPTSRWGWSRAPESSPWASRSPIRSSAS